MGLIGALLYLPIRIITFPFRLVFGSRSDENEKKAEPTPIRVSFEGQPGKEDIEKLCKVIKPEDMKNSEIKALCNKNDETEENDENEEKKKGGRRRITRRKSRRKPNRRRR
jgi:hypothetical protein